MRTTSEHLWSSLGLVLILTLKLGYKGGQTHSTLLFICGVYSLARPDYRFTRLTLLDFVRLRFAHGRATFMLVSGVCVKYSLRGAAKLLETVVRQIFLPSVLFWDVCVFLLVFVFCWCNGR